MISLRSKVTKKILNYFLINPKTKRYINELAQILDLDSKNVHRKLVELEKNGLLLSEFSGKQRYFYLAEKFPFLNEYRGIILKTVGIEQQLKELLKEIDGIDLAYIFGSYAKNNMDESSDIDLLVVGVHSSIELQKKINSLQKNIGREINVVNFSPEEFKEKKRSKNPFIHEVFSGKPIKLL